MTNPAKVLVLDGVSSHGVTILETASDAITVDLPDHKLSHDELLAHVADARGIIIRSATTITAQVIEAAPHLEVVGRAGIGTDNIDKPAATRRGIVVMNTPEGNTITTAEHALALMFSLARNVPQAVASLRGGAWDRKKYVGVELYRKTLGVIGLGHIGQVVADRALGLKMRVIGFDPYVDKELAHRMHVELVSLEELLAQSDFVTVHVPKTPDTAGMIDAAALKTMKPSARLVNCARGGIVVEDDLAVALQEGIIAGAALDVYTSEPPDYAHPLFSLPNCITTPHLGASTQEAQTNVSVDIANQLVDYFRSGTIRNAVNSVSLTAEQAKSLGPWMTLGGKLGRVAAQLHGAEVSAVKVTAYGELADTRDMKPLTASALEGVLQDHWGESLNLVNAPMIASERGIEVVASRSATVGRSGSRLTVSLQGGGRGTTSVSGGVRSDGSHHLLAVNGITLDAVLTGDLLLSLNHDRPGVMGRLCTALGAADINIERMTLGLSEETGHALSVISVNRAPQGSLLEELSQLPDVVTVKHVHV